MKKSSASKSLSGALLLITLITSSCYTVRFKVANSIPEPFPNHLENVYRDLRVYTCDTTVRINMLNKDFTMLVKTCPSGGLAIVEYRNTFGGVLLSAITLGRVRQIRVKYVCTKVQN